MRRILKPIMMRSCMLIITLSLLFISCNNKGSEPEEKEDTLIVTSNSYEAVLDDSGHLVMHYNKFVGPDSLTADAVTGFLNKRYPNVQLKLIKTSGDTLYMSIPEATYLTQQMGSTGPQLYFADVVYNLTEIPGIRYVNLDFEEGDHASPATLNRQNFKEE